MNIVFNEWDKMVEKIRQGTNWMRLENEIKKVKLVPVFLFVGGDSKSQYAMCST